MNAKRIHVIVNTHIDPVWIWSRRSGRNAWLNSITTNIAMMQEYPDLKFVCSASALYRWIEECDSRLFRDIREFVKEGRWDIVGGWEVQSDSILARNEPLLRQGSIAKEYFQDKFGPDVKIVYLVDSFGHPAGLPQILRSLGFTYEGVQRMTLEEALYYPGFQVVQRRTSTSGTRIPRFITGIDSSVTAASVTRRIR